MAHSCVGNQRGAVRRKAAGRAIEASAMTARARIFELSGRRVWVAGHRGMVGQALMRRLSAEDCEIVTARHDCLDLRRQSDVESWMAVARPDVVVLAAATVGGTLAAEAAPVDFLYDNLAIETNVIHAAYRLGIAKLLFLGSARVYPRDAALPIAEDALLSGPLEPTSEWEAVAKIAGIKLCQAYRRQYGADFIVAVPCDLYGPGDNFDFGSGHVIPALIARMHAAAEIDAPSIDVWGTGRARREFLYVDDLADAIAHLLAHYSDEAPVNVGIGRDISIAELAERIAAVVGYRGALRFDEDKPEGAPRKRLDIARMTGLGWRARIGLGEGLARTYAWYRAQCARAHPRLAVVAR